MKYTVWGKDAEGGREFVVVPDDRLPSWENPGMQLVKEIEAESWDDAMRQYYEWQGWEPYKPMPEG